MSPQLKYLGGLHTLQEGEADVYQGIDLGRLDENKIPTTIVLAVGQLADVSDQKAAQAVADFPGYFEVDGKKADAKSGGRGRKADIEETVEE